VRLCSYRDGDELRLGIVATGRVLPASELDAHAAPTMTDLLAGGDDALARLEEAAQASAERIAADGQPLDALELAAPVPRPGKVVAIGLNYHAHAEEQGIEAPAEPLIFAKFPSAVVGHGATVSWDEALTSRVDYEAELAVVIGRRARHVSEAEALDHVLGYTCANDITARDLQRGDGQWVRGKSLDTFCPLGPLLVTRRDLADPQALAVRCRVNGELLQDGSTRDMIFPVRRLVAHCSRAFTLEPGDVILTGTPPGVGFARRPPRYLADGDEVEVEVEGIGRLRNRCAVDARDSRQLGL
jgi:2-keto-4-pentenoate hydratase/2-oxohepta-3-ene-1,7-dioic acid hydratase in catechol pathway